MSYRAMDFAMQAKVDTSAERSVLVCLAWHMNDQTGRCDPSVDGIKERTMIGIHQVKAALKSLESKGLIKRIEVSGRRTQYIVVIDPVSIDTPYQSVPTPGTDQYPVPISTRYGSVPTPGTDQYPHPVLISTPNKEENKEENTTVVGATGKKRPALTYLFKDSGITELPSGWRKYCEERRPDINPDHAFADFRAWFVDGKGADERRGEKGWNSSWQGWVRRQKETPYQNGYSKKADDAASTYARICAMQERDKAS